ncbi:hypothetical protein AVEN_220277-1, partial [Araneus ventricosus]
MAVWSILKDRSLEEKAQILCSDTMNSNTSRINSPITFLKQYADRDMSYFRSRHQMYEKMQRSVFDHEV